MDQKNTPQQPLRVLVVDDSNLYRNIVSDILETIPGVEVVGAAANGEIALAMVADLVPDMLTLDVEMPVMDGLATLRRLREFKVKPVVVMVSAHTRQGAAVTLEALHLGAYDFITKPDEGDPEKNRERLTSMFRPIINAVMAQNILHHIRFGMGGGALGARQQFLSPECSPPPAPPTYPQETGVCQRIEIVAIGISTGGPNALADLLPRLPVDFPVPLVIVQHMPKEFTCVLAESLNAKSAIRVQEGQSGEILQAGTAYIAPGGRQMRVAIAKGRTGSGYCLEITDDPPENHCQPSADYLFRSVASLFKGHALGVIMTGMGCDGTLGLRLMKRHGAQIIAQDQASSVVYGMPLEAVKAGVVDTITPLSQLSTEIMRRVR